MTRNPNRPWPRQAQDLPPVPHPSWRGELPSGPKLSAREFWNRLGV